MRSYRKAAGQSMSMRRSILALFVVLALSMGLMAGCASEKPESSSSDSSASAASQSTASSSDNGASAASDDSSSSVSSSSDADEIAITIEIDPSAAEGKVPDSIDLSVIGPESMMIDQGASAYDALLATDADVVGSESYVTSINGLAVGDAGPESGWMYKINGESPAVPAGDFTLEAGDEVLWYYVDSFE